MRWRQLREQAIGLHEAMQRVSAAFNDAEAAAEIANRGFISADVFSARQQASGNGLDGRE